MKKVGNGKEELETLVYYYILQLSIIVKYLNTVYSIPILLVMKLK